MEKDSENHYYLSYNGAKEQEIIPGREILLDTLRNSEEASIGKLNCLPGILRVTGSHLKRVEAGS